MNDYKIKKLYEKMELEIISSMKRNLKRHLKEEDKVGFKFTQWQAEKLKELKRYQRQNKDIIREYNNNINKEISNHLQEELKQGSRNAIKQYNNILGKNLKPSNIMNRSFFRTNDRKVNTLIKVVNDDLKTANTSALRMANDQYRQVIHKSAFFVGNGAFTEQQTAKMATKELTDLKMTELAIDEANKNFLAGGLNCIEYSDGRRVNLASYSQMAVRTASLRAQLMGEGDFRKSIGRVLVQATSHGGACPICQKWENHIFIDDVYSGGTKKDGKYMLLSDAMKQGFLHPNCRHGLTTYYPELEDIENESDEEYQEDLDYINEKINYINRNIKKYDRLSIGSISRENIRFYENKKQQWIDQMKLTDIVNKVRKITPLEFQKRTAGVKIRRFEKNYSYIDTEANIIYLGQKSNEFTLIHELGHKLYLSLSESEEKVYNKIITNKFKNYSKKDFREVISKNRSESYFVLKDCSEFVSKYQTRIYNDIDSFINGKVNTDYALEYISEGVREYFQNPKNLLEKDKLLYKFIKKVIKDE